MENKTETKKYPEDKFMTYFHKKHPGRKLKAYEIIDRVE